MTAERVLVTGGAGFIGSAIARRLLNDGVDVVVVDNLSTGRKENVPAGAAFVEGDLADPETLAAVDAESVDAVFHLAGQSSGEKSFDDPEYDLNSHVVSTFNALRWCKSNDISRFLYASSMSIYGDPEYLPVDEQHPFDPKTYYAAGKIGAEAYVDLFENLGLNTTTFRLFSIYGPGQNLTNMKQGMVSIYLSFVLNGEDLLIKGPLDRFRDFVYIEDLVEAWMAAVNDPTTFGETYNLCRNERIEVKDLVETILKCYGNLEYPIEVVGGTPGDQFGIFGDASKLRGDIGWSPDISLEEGISRMIDAETDQ